MKKIFKIFFLLIFVVSALFTSIPLLFKKQITDIATAQINKSIDATVSFRDIHVSLFKNFPNATIAIADLFIQSDTAFHKDTLVFLESIHLKTGLLDIFEKRPTIKSIALENGHLNLMTNEQGAHNYDLSKKKDGALKNDTTDSSDFSLNIDSYQLKNINLNYLDSAGNVHLKARNLNHKGAAALNGKTIHLRTQSSIEKLSFSMENIDYLHEATANLKAEFDLDLKNRKFTFKENNLKINDLILHAEGFVQQKEENISMDFNFNTVSSEFKSLLSLIPSAYTSNFKDVKTTGDLNFRGHVKGLYNMSEIPKFKFHIDTKNASFKYPELPKTVEDIFINTEITNTTGKIDDTALVIKTLRFKIDQDVFSAKSKITNIANNPKVQATFTGRIDLKNISESYPLQLKQKLQGKIEAQITSSFTQKALENKDFKQISNAGYVSFHNFVTDTELLPNPIHIHTAQLSFDPKKISLTKLEAKTGGSDLELYGDIKNLYPYLFDHGELQGHFKMNSSFLNAKDVLTSNNTSESTTDTISSLESIKIPEKINAHLTVNAQKVLYDNLVLKDLTGTVKINDQKAVFEKTNAKMFEGNIVFEGFVNTKPNPSLFDFDLNIQNFDIASSFGSMELLNSMAPIAHIFNGKISTAVKLNGDLNNNFSPDLQSISGKALAHLKVAKIDPKKSKVLNLIDSQLSFVDFSKLNLKKIKAQASFEKGKVNFKPFKIGSYDGIPIQLSGGHSFNNQINYDIQMDFPASYFGGSIASSIANLSGSDKNEISVPITLSIDGSVNEPFIKTNMKSATRELTKKIAKAQKENLINSLLKSNRTKKDSTKKSRLKNTAKNLVKGLFN